MVGGATSDALDDELEKEAVEPWCAKLRTWDSNRIYRGVGSILLGISLFKCTSTWFEASSGIVSRTWISKGGATLGGT